eukprot:1159145-Pelagomonas_calceolata.AAC.11
MSRFQKIWCLSEEVWAKPLCVKGKKARGWVCLHEARRCMVCLKKEPGSREPLQGEQERRSRKQQIFRVVTGHLQLRESRGNDALKPSNDDMP